MQHLDLEAFTLDSGAHKSIEDGGCVMEFVSYMAHEPWSDHPKCASKVIGAFLRTWNDGMNDTDRQMLKPLIPRLVGTAASSAVEKKRSWMALDWYCRVSAPAWLRAAGLTIEAEAVEATSPIVDAKSAKAAQAALNIARQKAAAARDAAGAAARTAAGAAARTAAGAAARDAAGAAARDAARNAAAAAAWDAARTAARAAGDALRPTVEYLQASALGLVERMIAVQESVGV